MSTPDPRAVKTAKLLIATIDELPNGISKDAISQHLANEFSLPNKDICEVMEGIREHRRRRRRSKHGGRRRRSRRRRRHH
ncbi:hypothetical protein Trydic_g802 [Trypoxylus dichotomus]